jgi:hypothetical protein
MQSHIAESLFYHLNLNLMENTNYILILMVLIFLSLITFIVIYLKCSKKSAIDKKTRFDDLNKNLNSFELNIVTAINQNSQAIAKLVFEKLEETNKNLQNFDNNLNSSLEKLNQCIIAISKNNTDLINKIDSDNKKYLESIQEILNNKLQESNKIFSEGLNNINVTLKETINIQ